VTIELFLELLHAHLAALRSPLWRDADGAARGPALYLDAVDTQSLIAELMRLKAEADMMRRRLAVAPLRQRARYRKVP
jgi:hypothetical protein